VLALQCNIVSCTECNSVPSVQYFFITPSTFRSSEWFLCLGFRGKIYISHPLSLACYMPRFIHLNLVSLIILGEESKLLRSSIYISLRPSATFSLIGRQVSSVYDVNLYRGRRGTAPHLLSPGTSGGEWLTSGHGRFTPGKNLGTHWTGGWFDPRPVLHALKKKTIFFSQRDWNQFFYLPEFQIFLSTFFKLDTILQPNVALWKIKFLWIIRTTSIPSWQRTHCILIIRTSG